MASGSAMRCGPEQSRPELPDDLLQLEDLDDLELLRCLRARYGRREIYTWVGSVLVSVNPYHDIGVFSEPMIAQYAGSQGPSSRPHLFAAVTAALDAPGSRHALLISGESGAGKTEATRAALTFLARRCGSEPGGDADVRVRDRLLHSNLVLEAFGNAQTRQNGNSSRFGKFIEVHMSPQGSIAGASLQPYMLEASRVTGSLPKAERTYHVFYLLRAALAAGQSMLVTGVRPPASSPSAASLWKNLASAPEWAQAVRAGGPVLSASARLCGGPSEAECLAQFETLVERLLGTGMTYGQVASCACVVAAVGLLADEEQAVDAKELAAGLEALLGTGAQEVEGFLDRVETSVGAGGRETFVRARSSREAKTLRAAVAQEIYAALFAWLTRFIANGIAPPATVTSMANARRLGFLDLYGFEVFSSNGFEQLLINYCNERIQQLFNRQVFLSEAEEYATEGLHGGGEWQRLKAACQLPALTLLEGESGSTIGIFGVVNDRSRCGFEEGRSSDGSVVAEAIASACGGHKAFHRSTRCNFGVAHFAGEVIYDATHFVQKNTSAHRPDVLAFLRRCGGAFLCELVNESASAATGAAESSAGGAAGEPSRSRSPAARGRRRLMGSTLISSCRTELNQLCAALEARECRHIRCLRPNDSQVALQFDDTSMLRQCRYSGLLEATRIRRFGYAHRRPLSAFAARYADLLPKDCKAIEVLEMCMKIREVTLAGGISPEETCIGHTKVFLRTAALQWLECARNVARRRAAAIHVLAAARTWCASRQLHRLRRAVLMIQTSARGYLARLEVLRRRREAERAELEAASADAAADAAAGCATENLSTGAGGGNVISIRLGKVRWDSPTAPPTGTAGKWTPLRASPDWSPVRSPRGAPSVGTKRRPACSAVRVAPGISASGKENEAPAVKHENMRQRSPKPPKPGATPSGQGTAGPSKSGAVRPGAATPPRVTRQSPSPIRRGRRQAALLLDYVGPQAHAVREHTLKKECPPAYAARAAACRSGGGHAASAPTTPPTGEFPAPPQSADAAAGAGMQGAHPAETPKGPSPNPSANPTPVSSPVISARRVCGDLVTTLPRTISTNGRFGSPPRRAGGSPSAIPSRCGSAATASYGNLSGRPGPPRCRDGSPPRPHIVPAVKPAFRTGIAVARPTPYGKVHH
mmetsp:Transcript_116217/g.205819  ORF Transcript_116217/g.205819 Transcript_116217/m.205819 type:complete len:1162 (-) Transcript_116217:214-3699(-)